MIRRLYLIGRNVIMARGGLQPKGTYWYSRNGNRFADKPDFLLPMPNVAGFINGVLRQFWEKHGLGRLSLLVSESKRVRSQMQTRYPNTQFVSTDLFASLLGDGPESGPDVTWDVCKDPPAALRKERFDSVIAHALLEHVVNPVFAIENFFSLMSPKSHCYLMTHTPSFHYHAYPRDYVRFHHDFFEDLPAYLRERHGYIVELEELYSKEGTICVCYARNT